MYTSFHVSKLKLKYHINEKVNKSYSVLGLIYRNFKYMSSDTFVMLYKTLVRSHLEYANCVWSPYRQMDIDKIEKVQMRATRMVQQLKNLSYEARLRRLNLPTLKYRRLRGDMIQVYNIVSGKHTTNPTIDLKLSNISNTIEVICINCNYHMYIITYVSIFLVIELLQFGIVFLTLLLMQSLLTYSRIVYILV